MPNPVCRHNNNQPSGSAGGGRGPPGGRHTDRPGPPHVQHHGHSPILPHPLHALANRHGPGIAVSLSSHLCCVLLRPLVTQPRSIDGSRSSTFLECSLSSLASSSSSPWPGLLLSMWLLCLLPPSSFWSSLSTFSRTRARSFCPPSYGLGRSCRSPFARWTRWTDFWSPASDAGGRGGRGRT